MVIDFRKATKYESKLRLALIGPAGSGKTYSALAIAKHLGGKVAVLDTEHGSASKYADLFEFDVVTPQSFNPTVYMDTITAAEQAGYDILIVDSLSHAWSGKDGILEFVDTETSKSRSKNAFNEGWRKASPLHGRMIDAILAADLHIIATIRSKVTYEVVENDRGKKEPRKIGLQPVQREGMEYEFDVIGDLDQDNRLVVSKSRCPDLTGQLFDKPGKEIAGILTAWLAGETAPERPKPAPAPTPQPSTGGNGSPDYSAEFGLFTARVLEEIPYYNHEAHIKNTLKQAGYKGFGPDIAARMRASLEQHASEKADAEAADAEQETLNLGEMVNG